MAEQIDQSKLIIMRKLFLLSGLLVLLNYPTFSQENNFPEIKQWSYSKQVDTALLNLFSGIQIDSLLSITNSKHDYHLQGIFETPERNIINDNMPCIKPKGNYPLLFVIPDTTIRYTLLIKKP
jgi:hypothetical protein